MNAQGNDTELDGGLFGFTLPMGFIGWIVFVVGIIIFAVLFIGLLFSMHKARFLASVQSDSWRSLWCFVSNSLPVIALGLGYYFYKKKKVDKI